MRYRLSPRSVGRKVERKRPSRSALLACLLMLCLSGFALLSDFKGTAATGPMQLVRLNISTESGLVKIEVVADGSFDEATVEHFTRGSESVFRVRGARSLLRQNYEINETVAHDVRTVAGESNGEPYVDVAVTLGDGATVAERKSFNRLVIGVAADFARLRHHSSSTDVAKARIENVKPSAQASAATLPVIANHVESTTTEMNPLPASNYSASDPVPSDALPTPALTASVPPTVFRGRTIWTRFPAPSFQFSRAYAASFLPMFFQQSNGLNSAAQTTSENFINVMLQPPGAKLGAWIPGTTAAEKDTVGGKALGKGYLRPSFLLGAAYSDNYFYRSPIGRHMGIFTFNPRLEYELPGATRALRLAYEPRLRRLTNGKWANGQVFDFDSRFDLASYFRLALRNHFIRSALDPREYDPAGEVYIVGDTFNRDDVALRAEYKIGQRSRLAFDGDYNLVRWDTSKIAVAPLFINYTEASSGGTFERDISEDTTLLATFTFTNGVSSAPLRPRFNGLNDFHRYDIEVGGRVRVSEASGATFKVGFERDIFRNAPRANNFSGLIFDLRFRRDFGARTNLELAALRKTQVSAFNLEGGNARLVSTGGDARVESSWTQNLKFALGINYQQLGFPVAVVPTTTASGGLFIGQFAGERRKDHLYGFSWETSYTFSDLLKTRFGYSFLRRDSTIPLFTHNRNLFSLVFEVGRRNDPKGRPF